MNLYLSQRIAEVDAVTSPLVFSDKLDRYAVKRKFSLETAKPEHRRQAKNACRKWMHYPSAGVAKMLDYGIDGEHAFGLFEVLPGQRLDTYVQSNGRFNIQNFAPIGEQMADIAVDLTRRNTEIQPDFSPASLYVWDTLDQGHSVGLGSFDLTRPESYQKDEVPTIESLALCWFYMLTAEQNVSCDSLALRDFANFPAFRANEPLVKFFESLFKLRSKHDPGAILKVKALLQRLRQESELLAQVEQMKDRRRTMRVPIPAESDVMLAGPEVPERLVESAPMLVPDRWNGRHAKIALALHELRGDQLVYHVVSPNTAERLRTQRLGAEEAAKEGAVTPIIDLFQRCPRTGMAVERQAKGSITLAKLLEITAGGLTLHQSLVVMRKLHRALRVADRLGIRGENLQAEDVLLCPARGQKMEPENWREWIHEAEVFNVQVRPVSPETRTPDRGTSAQEVMIDSLDLPADRHHFLRLVIRSLAPETLLQPGVREAFVKAAKRDWDRGLVRGELVRELTAVVHPDRESRKANRPQDSRVTRKMRPTMVTWALHGARLAGAAAVIAAAFAYFTMSGTNPESAPRPQLEKAPHPEVADNTAYLISLNSSAVNGNRKSVEER